MRAHNPAQIADALATTAPHPFSPLDLASHGTVVVAVSGGSDSLALLHLLKTHLGDRARSILAVTVDHGLRPESSCEADAVARLCEGWGLRHRTMLWHSEKPVTGIQQAARLARYRLLASAAEQAGATVVLTGHTADDLAETVAMRHARGPGPGLAGIAPATLFRNAIWFVRPLLSFRRDDLRAVLAGEGIGWADDPSNRDERFERVRFRKSLLDGERDLLLKRVAAAVAERESISTEVAAWLFAAADMPSPGLVRIRRTALGDAHPRVAVAALRLVLSTIGGRSHLPPEGPVRRLIDKAGHPGWRTALAGSIMDVRKEAVWLHREWRGTGPHPVTVLGRTVFDGRFRFTSAQSTSVRPLGFGSEVPSRPDVPASLAARALACEPTVPGSGSATRLVSPYAQLLPSFDLAATQAIARLVGADVPPQSPWSP